MNIVGIVGSISENSYNKRLINYMKERYKDKINIEIITLEKLPMYNEDIELEPEPIVKEIKDKIKNSDGIIIATPEYNHSIPGVLKNALDWFSRVERVMLNKPTMIVGVSQGSLGTVKAQIHLRQVLNSVGIGALTLPGNEVFIGDANKKINEKGELIHEPTIQFLDQVVSNFINWSKKVS